MFSWFNRLFNRRQESSEPKVLVFLNPLAMLLAAAEQKKGSPLTREEVFAVRDAAVCTAMPASQAEKFYNSMETQFPGLYPRLNPEHIWEEWQSLTGRSERG